MRGARARDEAAAGELALEALVEEVVRLRADGFFSVLLIVSETPFVGLPVR